MYVSTSKRHIPAHAFSVIHYILWNQIFKSCTIKLYDYYIHLTLSRLYRSWLRRSIAPLWWTWMSKSCTLFNRRSNIGLLLCSGLPREILPISIWWVPIRSKVNQQNLLVSWSLNKVNYFQPKLLSINTQYVVLIWLHLCLYIIKLVCYGQIIFVITWIQIKDG